MRRLVLLVAGLALLAGVAAGLSGGATQGEARWVITDLGTLGGRQSAAWDINERGQIIGRSQIRGGAWHAFLLKGSTMVDLGTLGGRASEAHGINERGEVVGWSERRAREPHAFLWRNGRMLDLGTLGGRRSWGHAINGRGEVVGWSETKPPVRVHAFLWRAGRMIDLGTLGGRRSIAVGINDRSQVVGVSDTATGLRRAFLWRAGRMVDLGTSVDPGPVWRGTPGGFWGGPSGINDHGEIIGFTGSAPGGGGFGYAFRAGRVTALATGGHDYAIPHGINDRGEIVGQTMSLGHFYATRWVGTRATYLEDLISDDEFPPNRGGGSSPRSAASDAWALNARGQIVGESSVTDYWEDDSLYRYHAVLWTLNRG